MLISVVLQTLEQVVEEPDQWAGEEQQQQQQQQQQQPSVYENLPEAEAIDSALVAVALYDYQAGADDEISFDPDDVITNIEMVIKNPRRQGKISTRLGGRRVKIVANNWIF